MPEDAPQHYDEIDEGEWYYDHAAYFDLQRLGIYLLFTFLTVFLWWISGDRLWLGGAICFSGLFCGAGGYQLEHWYRSTHADRPS